MNRQYYNLKIANILKGYYPSMAEEFSFLASNIPQQRAGQIFVNYIIPEHPYEDIKDVLEFLFPNNPDPFFEESSETFKRITNG